MSTYDSTKDSLDALLKEINKGKIQLPEFQRDWVWDDAHVLSLLASISLSYPIGAIMTLQTGGDDVHFKNRPIEGSEPLDVSQPDWLILDGQQRMTALYQSLFSQVPVITRDIRKKSIKRYYYVDIDKVLSVNGDHEEAIVSLPEDRIIKNFRGEVEADYSSQDKECTEGMLPLNIVMHNSKLTEWQIKYLKKDPENTAERVEKWNKLHEKILKPIQQYQVPIIQLKKETPKVAVCQVFEKVNTGGVSLTVFELLTATFAAEGFDLRADWSVRKKKLKEHPVLHNLQSDDFLQAISLLVTKARRDGAIDQGKKPDQAPGISCKRKDILKLDHSDYQLWADYIQDGFIKAAKFLHQQMLFNARDLPYRTQVVPLATIIAALGDDGETDGARQQITRWYWSGIFGELYGSAIETRFAKDFPEVVNWVRGGPDPSTISDANFTSSRFYTLRTRNSAAYKGLYAILMLDGGLDLRTGERIDVQTYFDDNVDIHHIFPRKWCEDNQKDRGQYDSIVNKTAISARTNRKIGGKAPSIYLPNMESAAGISTERMNEILRSHAIDTDAIRADDFEKFFEQRTEALLKRIEKAMGKAVTREAAPETIEDSDDIEENEDE